jgi:hypothetical protein
MSLDPILWALKDAPVANVEERMILTFMAEAADDDGCNSHQSQQTIAKLSMLADRTVRKRLKDMEDRKLIARGDQTVSTLMRIPADRRPVNYDLMIPHTWFSNIRRINEYRENRGRPPITPSMRPDIADPPAPKRRSDFGVSRKHSDDEAPVFDDASEAGAEEAAAGLQVRPSAGLQVRPDESDITSGNDRTASPAGLQDRDGGTSSPTTLPKTLPNKNPPLLLDPLLTEQDHSPSEEEEGEASPEKTPDITKIAKWFVVKLRTDWTDRDVEAALATAVTRKMGTLTVAAQALRELVTNGERYGRTDKPGRLLVSGDWWKAVRPKSAAAKRKLAEEPRCQVRTHGRYPADRCVPCMTSKYDGDAPEPDAEKDAAAAAYTRAVRERQGWLQEADGKPAGADSAGAESAA